MLLFFFCKVQVLFFFLFFLRMQYFLFLQFIWLCTAWIMLLDFGVHQSSLESSYDLTDFHFYSWTELQVLWLTAKKEKKEKRRRGQKLTPLPLQFFVYLLRYARGPSKTLLQVIMLWKWAMPLGVDSGQKSVGELVSLWKIFLCHCILKLKSKSSQSFLLYFVMSALCFKITATLF